MKVFYKNAQINPVAETDYDNVYHKISINQSVLEGDKSTEEANITWFGTEAEFNNLTFYNPNTIYIIDDSTPVGTTKNYFFKVKKPSINDVELEGAKLSSDLSMYTKDEVDNIIASMRSVKTVSVIPAAPLANTIYYVGPNSENIYEIYLVDSTLSILYLGTTYTQILTSGAGATVVNNVISVKYDNTSINTNINNELQVKWLADKSEGEDDRKPIFLQNNVFKAFTHSITDLLYPVGTIYKTTALSTVAQVEAQFGGTWVAWGTGECPVGVSTESEFDAVEKTGGVKSVILDETEIPSHTHTFLGWAGMQTNNYTGGTNIYLGVGIWSRNFDNTGNSDAHNNLMPYITCYMYKRVA